MRLGYIPVNDIYCLIGLIATIKFGLYNSSIRPCNYIGKVKNPLLGLHCIGNIPCSLNIILGFLGYIANNILKYTCPLLIRKVILAENIIDIIGECIRIVCMRYCIDYLFPVFRVKDIQLGIKLCLLCKV